MPLLWWVVGNSPKPSTDHAYELHRPQYKLNHLLKPEFRGFGYTVGTGPFQESSQSRVCNASTSTP